MATLSDEAAGVAGTLPEAARASTLRGEEERLLACVHCGFCLPACPTYTRLGDEADSPRGRLYLMRAVAEGRLDPGADAFQLHIDRCVGCRACETVCPSGVQYGALLEVARAEAAGARPPFPLARLLLAVFRSERTQGVFMALSRLLRATRLPALAARVLPSTGSVGRLRLALGMLASTGSWRPGRRPFRRAGHPHRSRAARAPGGSAWAAGEGGTAPRTAALLDGCVQRGLFAGVNRATARVLRVNGTTVLEAPGQGCCGALHAHGGALDVARALARRNVDAFEAAGAETVVVNAAGCGAVMKEYGELLAGDEAYAERAARLAERVRDVSEVLAEAGPVRGAALPVEVTYDAPCHLLHAQRVSEAPLAVLAAVPGLVVRALEGADECCGGAGIYGLTHVELGGRIGRDKADAVRRTGAEVVVTGNPGCAMQIGAWLRTAADRPDVAHPVELLDESYRRAGFYHGRGRG